MLDSHPDNILGKGILPPAQEKVLIARGIVFAVRLTAQPATGKPFEFLHTSKRPYADVLNTRTPKRATRTPVRA